MEAMEHPASAKRKQARGARGRLQRAKPGLPAPPLQVHLLTAELQGLGMERGAKVGGVWRGGVASPQVHAFL